MTTSPHLITFGTPLHKMERGKYFSFNTGSLLHSVEKGMNSPKAKKGMRIFIFGILFFILGGGFASAQTTFDPLSIGVGARALGMGKAYVAVAEDSDTIFTNPAGLGEIDNFQFTSMSGKIMEEVNYTLFGGVYPIGNKQAIGIGYVAA